MARPSKQRPPEQTDAIAAAGVNHVALADAGDAATIRSAEIALVDERFGIDLPYQLDLYVARGRQLVAETSARMLELGLLLIQIREREAHGQFHGALERIGIDVRFAQRSMQVARKFGSNEHRRALAQSLGTSKVLALLTEDEADIDALADGDELAGYTADEFARMTKNEVIAALRKARADAEEEKAATDQLVAKRDDRIRKLERERNRLAKGSAQVKAEDLVQQLCAAAIEVERAARAMVDIAGEIEHVHDEAGEQIEEGIQQVIETQIEYATTALNDLLAVVGE